jgi:hypothetical protein
MNPELSMVLSLRRVLESAAAGKGMSRGLIEELGPAEGAGADVARMLLLGYPLGVSLKPLERSSEEAAMLASLMISTPRSSATLVGNSGKALADTLERWVKAKESRRLEQRVQRFRSLVTSAVLGAVTAMIATLGPVVGNLSFGTPSALSPRDLLVSAAGMAAVGSGMLGLYMSGRRFPANIVVALAAFAFVSGVASPLTNLPSIAFWGVK